MDSEFVHISTSNRLQLGYGIGHVLNDVCASLWFTYFLVFFHLVLEFSASQSGNLMLIGQVMDALSTPFVGYHSDHTDNHISSKYGRRKLWHLFGTVCVLASFPFIFTECIGCSSTHKWAQMYYYAAFIIIFQIGWAAVQISHLSLIPELSEDDHTRTHLTAIRYFTILTSTLLARSVYSTYIPALPFGGYRYGFTVFSNLFVYIITWIILHLTGECDKHQVGPTDAWKFRHVVYIVLGVGTLASVIFHISVTEKNNYRHEQLLAEGESGAHYDFLRKPLMYQVAGVYMCTRLVVNISQVLIPLYLHRTLGLAARALAVVPLSLYLGSLAAAGVQRLAPRSFTRKLNYLTGSACAIAGFVWIYLGSDDDYKVYFIYVVAVLIGFGGAVMLVTSLALTADLVGARTEASAFVYGLMSFTDKLACGIAIAIIQAYADGADPAYYGNALVWVCGIAAIIGLTLTLLLPRFRADALLNSEDSSINNSNMNTEERAAPIESL